MINRHTVFEIHRLYNQGLSKQRIADTIHIDPKTVTKFLRDPDPKKRPRKRSSKLDPFKQEIARLLEIDPKASAPVILQRIGPMGFDGGITILKDYLQSLRGRFKNKDAGQRGVPLPLYDGGCLEPQDRCIQSL
jgi:transposase